MSDRDRILDRLPTPPPDARSHSPGTVQEGDWGVFQERLWALGGQWHSLESLDRVRGRNAVWDARLQTLATTLDLRPTDVWDADLGLSRAEFAIAETGTVVLSAGPESLRLSSLAPPLNIVVVERLVATLDDGFSLGMPERTAVLVTGPSRTADIEGILVRGVHGPGELWVVRADQPPF